MMEKVTRIRRNQYVLHRLSKFLLTITSFHMNLSSVLFNMNRMIRFRHCKVFIVLRNSNNFIRTQLRNLTFIQGVLRRRKEINIIISSLSNQFGMVLRAINRVNLRTFKGILRVQFIIRTFTRVELMGTSSYFNTRGRTSIIYISFGRLVYGY